MIHLNTKPKQASPIVELPEFIDIMSIYKSFPFEWDLLSDEMSWSVQVRHLLGERNLYSSGDKYASQMDVEDFNQRMAALYRFFQDPTDTRLTYHLCVQEDQICKVEEHLLGVDDRQSLMICANLRSCSDVFPHGDFLSSLTPQIDSLTGLPDKQMMFKELEQLTEAKEDQSSAFAYIMIDKLSQITVRHGLEVMNQIIKSVGDKIRTSIRPDDSLSRMAGNSFGLILRECGQEEIVTVAERLSQTFEEGAVSIPGTEEKVDISVGGIVFRGSQGVTPHKVLARAKSALLDAQEIKHLYEKVLRTTTRPATKKYRDGDENDRGMAQREHDAYACESVSVPGEDDKPPPLPS